MSGPVITIKRYPSRRYYARSLSRYVSLQEIEDWVRAGKTVEIRDGQTDEDLTCAVLTQIIIERYPEKVSLFPTDLLHAILRSNDMMTGFLREYFRHSLAYLEYLQRHNTAVSALIRPMYWVRAWLNELAASGRADTEPAVVSQPPLVPEGGEPLQVHAAPPDPEPRP
jgi:polyhydroxyalkanoate synthesis repressor PhaR